MLTIVLTEASFRCLQEGLSQQSPASKALSNARHVEGSVRNSGTAVVTCELQDAETLLTVAERSCHAAIIDIKTAIIQEKRKPKD